MVAPADDNNRTTEQAPPEFLTSRGRQTRNALIEAAKVVFGRDGFLNARIADISSQAGMAHGSLYHYFASKEEIFKEVVKAVQADMAMRPTEQPESNDPQERIRLANQQYVSAYRRNAALMATLEQVATFDDDIKELRIDIRSRFVERNSRAIRRWQAEGLADPELDPRVAANALGAMVDRFVYIWLVLGEEFDEEAALKTLTRLWIQALGMKISAAPHATGGRDQTRAHSKR